MFPCFKRLGKKIMQPSIFFKSSKLASFCHIAKQKNLKVSSKNKTFGFECLQSNHAHLSMYSLTWMQFPSAEIYTDCLVEYTVHATQSPDCSTIRSWAVSVYKWFQGEIGLPGTSGAKGERGLLGTDGAPGHVGHAGEPGAEVRSLTVLY